ncbi:putative Ser/Thr protein kinase [Povalibacter uvarum]|uniref:Putative Ser/Thr protein kinase n=1 Tax=Povalibacter uvarum TaxID=732238 RepID=A0A841HKS1_9GAMM|nr:serine/threonine-protein kinase [Povalibacter uvarum]MBB6092969.1 putative Ser/Thr protein kinase [Povalibacter uvarum]
MASTLDQILAGLASGQLTVEAASAQLEAVARANPLQRSAIIARVQTDVAAGRLPHPAARAALAAIDRAIRQVEADKTVAMGDSTLVDPDATSMRQPTAVSSPTAVHSATEVHSPTEVLPVERTVSMAQPLVAKTLVRPAPTEDDATEMRSAADKTLQTPSDTLRIEVTDADETRASATRAVDADETVRTQKQFPPTAARTLKADVDTQGLSPYAATLKYSSDKTEVISERLVQTLDEADEPRRGELKPGSIVKKRFVLEMLLGKGGMGLVFGAIDRRKEEAQDPNPRVALKVLNADFERHPQSFIALQREARKAQTLAHPNVVTVFDFDRDGETVYMTMELLKGRSLESIVREARGKGIKREIAMPIIRGIAEGLAYAHRKGIVHSDLKPGNVFIAEDGTAKILDFGIARAVPSSVTPENKDVFDAGSLGAYTEAYATDEMIDGVDPHPADDMYALGIIGYELLTGYHPYQRHGAPSARKLGIKPPPLKGLKLREAKALERCLSFDRKQRPKDAGEFLKLFRGVTMLQKMSLAAAVVLAIASGYFWYQNYLETSPAIPFAQLPAETQQQITAALQDGEKEWAFYKQGMTPAIEQSVTQYATAYALHPRNRDAVKGLRRAADEMLRLAGEDTEMRHSVANNLLESSEYFRKYQPVVDASR